MKKRAPLAGMTPEERDLEKAEILRAIEKRLKRIDTSTSYLFWLCFLTIIFFIGSLFI